MNPEDYNKWLAIPGGAGALGVGLWLWQYLVRSKLNVTRDNAEGSYIEAGLKASKELMSRANDAEGRAKVNYDLFLAEERRATAFAARIPALESRLRGCETREKELLLHLRTLARLIIDLAPEPGLVRPYVHQWLTDSGFAALDEAANSNDNYTADKDG